VAYSAISYIPPVFPATEKRLPFSLVVWTKALGLRIIVTRNRIRLFGQPDISGPRDGTHRKGPRVRARKSSNRSLERLYWKGKIHFCKMKPTCLTSVY
jgi:hypothetical protein